MFPIKAKRSLPIHQIVINSISVRGRLGPLTVWVTKDEEAYRDEEKKRLAIEEAAAAAAASAAAAAAAASASSSSPSSSPTPKKSRDNLRARLSRSSSKKSTEPSSTRAVQPIRGEISMKKKHWIKIYEREHAPSFRDYTELDLSATPIVLTPGQVRGVYIHSTLPGDEAIVYDNKHKMLTHDDGFITILPGRAHVSERPFGRMPIWGWGNAWRDNREFVGRVSYGAVYRLWNPAEHLNFGSRFQRLALTLFKCQRRWESPLSLLGDDVIFYILNMCKWDWVDDDVNEIAGQQKEMRKLRRRREALLAATEAAAAATAAASTVTANAATSEGGCANFARALAEGGCAIGDDDDRKMPAEDCKIPAIVSPEIGSTVARAAPSQELLMDDSSDEDQQDDGDEEYEELESDDSDEEIDSDDYDEYRGIDPSVFHYRDYEEEDSDDEGINEERRLAEAEDRRRSWLRSQFARIHVLNALASMNDGNGGGEAEAEAEVEAMDVDSDDAAVAEGGGESYIRHGDDEDDDSDEDYVDGYVDG